MNAGGSDRGSVTLVGALAGLALLLLTGLVVDGAGRARSAERAERLAAEAARAAVDAAAPRDRQLVLDQPAALRAARSYLATAGVSGSVTVTGPRTVQVDVTVPGRYLILGILGHADYTAAGQASATLSVGVTAGEP